MLKKAFGLCVGLAVFVLVNIANTALFTLVLPPEFGSYTVAGACALTALVLGSWVAVTLYLEGARR